MSVAHLSRLTIAAVAGPAVPFAALTMPLIVYLPAFYAGRLGIPLSIVGAVFTAVRLIDIAVDPVLGILMDRTTGRFGRFKPWLAASVPMLVGGGFMLFAPPETASAAYLFVALLVCYIGWSILGLAQMGLMAGISANGDERARIYAAWQGGFAIGILLMAAVPKLVEVAGQDSPEAPIHAMAWFVALAAIGTVAISLLVVKEARAPIAAIVPLADYFRLLRRPTVGRLMAVELALGVGSGVAGSTIIFYFSRVKGLSVVDVSVIIFGSVAISFLILPIWAKIAVIFEKHKALLFATCIAASAQCIIIFIGRGNFWQLFGAYVLVNIAVAAHQMFPRAMMADVADEEMLIAGRDVTATLYALLIGTFKVGQAVSIALSFWMLQFVGFNPEMNATNKEVALTGLSLLFIAVPAALFVSAGVLIRRWPLTQARHDQIRAKLEEARRDRPTEVA